MISKQDIGIYIFLIDFNEHFHMYIFINKRIKFGFKELLILLAWLLSEAGIASQPILAPSALCVSVNGAVVREYSIADLMSLPQRTIKTRTIWSDGIQEFEGPSLSSILYDAGVANRKTLEFKSLDDFSIQIPTFSVSRVYPIVAIKHNGKAMNVRDNGPFRVIYPYDNDPSLKTEIIFAQSVMMLREINILE